MSLRVMSPIGVFASSLGGVEARYNGDIGKLSFLLSRHRRTGNEGWRRRASCAEAAPIGTNGERLLHFAQRLSSVRIRAIVCTILCATVMPTNRRSDVFTLVTKRGGRC